jgi:hypothetical protein
MRLKRPICNLGTVIQFRPHIAHSGANASNKHVESVHVLEEEGQADPEPNLFFFQPLIQGCEDGSKLRGTHLTTGAKHSDKAGLNACRFREQELWHAPEDSEVKGEPGRRQLRSSTAGVLCRCFGREVRHDGVEREETGSLSSGRDYVDNPPTGSVGDTACENATESLA